MSQHTPGRLSLFTLYADPEIRQADAGVLVAVVPPWGVASEQPDARHANARRLVACWNACDGLLTEQVEQIDGLLPAKLSYQVMQRQREALLADLEHVVQWFDQITAADVARYRATIATAKAAAA